MKQFLLVLLGAIVVCFSSCKEEFIPATSQELDTELYPLEVGRTWIYQTDSVVFSKQLNSIDTFIGFVKEEITEEFVTNDDNTTYVIERSFRRSLEDEWNKTDIYSAALIDNMAIRTEENLRFVKLLFPTALGQQWEGNQFFDDYIFINVGGELVDVYKNWKSKVTEVDTTVLLAGIEYDNSIEVIVSDTESNIEKRFVKEIYAKDVGLISKEMIIIKTQKADTSFTILDRAEMGFTLSQSLIEYY